ncbi:hypothetical protein ACLMJK_004680 [Lecanora helva]
MSTFPRTQQEGSTDPFLEAIVISRADPELTGREPLPEISLTGNVFFTILAGHETLGSTMRLIFVFLALRLEYQKQIQKELDAQLRTRSKREWTIEKDYRALQKDNIGAVPEMLYFITQAPF